MGAKIVLDTNVFVSAFGWRGAPNKIFQECTEGRHRLFTSPSILEELNRVLHYKKFNFSSEDIEAFLSIVLETASLVLPEVSLDIIVEDPSDNRILECAISARAEIIVSGDKHLLDLKIFQGVKIIKPEQF
jgi:putative PIN family toxin of toxin-antitoxin system